MADQEKGPQRGIDLYLVDLETRLSFLSDPEVLEVARRLSPELREVIKDIDDINKDFTLEQKEKGLENYSRKMASGEKHERVIQETFNAVSMRPELVQKLRDAIDHVEVFEKDND